MKTMKKVFVAAVSMMLIISMTACSDSNDPNQGNATDAIKIGLHFELSGELADYGNAELKGAQLAIKQANEAAGYEKYAGIVYDNKSDASESVILSNQLVADKVVGVVGPATSGNSAASYQVLNDAKIAVISPSATANNVTFSDPKDTTSPIYEYVFRVCFEDSYQGAAMAQYAYDTLGKTKAVIYGDSTTDYAKGLAESFEQQFTKLGGEIVSVENYVGKDTDFSSVLTKIQGLDFDLIYIPGYYAEVGLIIKQAREMGITQPIVGPDGFGSSLLVQLAGENNLNDVYFTTAYSTVGASNELQAFLDAYTTEYSEDPSMFSALAFDSVNVLIQAIEEADSTEAEAIQAALVNIDFTGITGDFSFDNTHTPIKSVLVVKLIDGVQAEAEAVSPQID